MHYIIKTNKMKKGIIAFSAIAAFAIGTMAFIQPASKHGEDTVYLLDAQASKLSWKGGMADNSKSHNGTINLSEGTVVYHDGAFKSGNFTVDMKSINTEDLKGAMGDTLDSHLSAGYFFQVANFPATKVTIKSVSATEIKAVINVVGKDIDATIPVKMSTSAKKLTAKGSFKLDIADAGLPGLQPHDPANPDKRISSVLNFDLDLVLATK